MLFSWQNADHCYCSGSSLLQESIVLELAWTLLSLFLNQLSVHIHSISLIVSVLYRIIISNFWIFLSWFYLTNLITLQKLFFIHIKYSNVFIRTP